MSRAIGIATALISLLIGGCSFTTPTEAAPSDPFSMCSASEACLAIELLTPNSAPNRFEQCDSISGAAIAIDCDGSAIKMAELKIGAAKCVLPAYWTIHVPPLNCLLTFDITAEAFLSENSEFITGTERVPGIGPTPLGGQARTKIQLVLAASAK